MRCGKEKFSRHVWRLQLIAWFWVQWASDSRQGERRRKTPSRRAWGVFSARRSCHSTRREAQTETERRRPRWASWSGKRVHCRLLICALGGTVYSQYVGLFILYDFLIWFFSKQIISCAHWYEPLRCAQTGNGSAPRQHCIGHFIYIENKYHHQMSTCWH